MLAYINVKKCDPSKCEEGRCAARKGCPKKTIYQEEKGDVPFLNGGNCNGCGKCVTYCPSRAIYMA